MRGFSWQCRHLYPTVLRVKGIQYTLILGALLSFEIYTICCLCYLRFVSQVNITNFLTIRILSEKMNFKGKRVYILLVDNSKFSIFKVIDY